MSLLTSKSQIFHWSKTVFFFIFLFSNQGDADFCEREKKERHGRDNDQSLIWLIAIVTVSLCFSLFFLFFKQRSVWKSRSDSSRFFFLAFSSILHFSLDSIWYFDRRRRAHSNGSTRSQSYRLTYRIFTRTLSIFNDVKRGKCNNKTPTKTFEEKSSSCSIVFAISRTGESGWKTSQRSNQVG